MKNLALHIFDLVENSVRAGSSIISVTVALEKGKDLIWFSITDNGKGMSLQEQQEAVDPFYTSRSTRRVGLGLPLIKQNTEGAGGFFSLQSKEGEGTCLKGGFQLSHWDCPPVGELSEIVVLVHSGNKEIHFKWNFMGPLGTYNYDSYEINEILNGIAPSKREIRQFLGSMVEEHLHEIGLV